LKELIVDAVKSQRKPIYSMLFSALHFSKRTIMALKASNIFQEENTEALYPDIE